MLVSAEHGMIYTANYGGSSFSTLRLGAGGEVIFLLLMIILMLLVILVMLLVMLVMPTMLVKMVRLILEIGSRWAMWSVWKIFRLKEKPAETRRIHTKLLSKVF